MSRLVSSLLLLTVFLAPGLSQEASAPTQVSENSVQALLINRVPPMYPPLARQARIQGTVILRIVINKAGEVGDVQLVSGHPMLAPAAIESVKKWKYRPYTKNGEAIEVTTIVQVKFTIADDPAPNGVVGSVPGGLPPGAIGSVSSPDQNKRVSEAEMRPQRIQQIDPVYPPLAIQHQIQGMVILDVQIAPSGDVSNVKLISGHPTLIASAIEAVRQWRYRPYMVNGNAVPVTTMVRLQFALTENDPGGVVTEPAPLQTMMPTALDDVPKIPHRVRVSSGVSQRLLASKVTPEYPPDARDQHIQGVVLLQVRIDKEGNVAEVNLIAGHPLLAPAAIDAVRQWKYYPYLLNGEPVEVDTQVQVNFTLAN